MHGAMGPLGGNQELWGQDLRRPRHRPLGRVGAWLVLLEEVEVGRRGPLLHFVSHGSAHGVRVRSALLHRNEPGGRILPEEGVVQVHRDLRDHLVDVGCNVREPRVLQELVELALVEDEKLSVNVAVL